MIEFLLVGLGGAIGAMLRYGITLIPIKYDFPYITLLINFIGALAIGMLAALATKQTLLKYKQELLISLPLCYYAY